MVVIFAIVSTKLYSLHLRSQSLSWVIFPKANRVFLSICQDR